jgi:hypothetical protein
MRQDSAEFATTQFIFTGDRPKTITAISGVINQQGRPFTQGFEVHLEGVSVIFDMANLGGRVHVSTPVTVLTQNDEIFHPDILSTNPVDAFVSELGEAIKAVERRSSSSILDGTLAIDALRLCHLETESIRSGQEIVI